MKKEINLKFFIYFIFHFLSTYFISLKILSNSNFQSIFKNHYNFIKSLRGIIFIIHIYIYIYIYVLYIYIYIYII